MQPHPEKNPGGDCFACSLFAVLRHLFPDNHPDFDTVFDYFKVESISGSIGLNNVWSGFRDAVYKARADEYKVEIANDLVIPEFKPERYSHTWWLQFPDQEWSRRLEAWLSAGWVAVAEIDHEGRGPILDNGKINCPDHFVIIDGVRIGWQPIKTYPEAKEVVSEAHVVCSMKGKYWIDTIELIQKYGAAGLWLVREDKR